MVLYLVESDVPAVRAGEYATWLASHVTKVVAAMGRSATASRAHVVGGEEGRFLALYELPSIPALESYLMSRERAELAEETEKQWSDGKFLRTFGERAAQQRRGMRFGEEAGAAFVVRVSLPAADAEAWMKWYEAEHMPEVLADPGFVRSRYFELHSDDDSVRQFIVIYDAVDLDAVIAFREGRGHRLGEQHASRFPTVQIERQVWEWQQ